MNGVHYWQGTWVGRDEARARLDDLDAVAEQVLAAAPMSPLVVMRAGDKLAAVLRNPDDEVTVRARGLLAEQGVPEPEIDRAVLGLGAALRRESLERKVVRELGGTDPARLARPRLKDDVFEAWVPVGLLGHVVPGNAPTAGVLSAVEGLLAGNVNVLKTSGGDTAFTAHVLAALAACDSSGEIARRLVVLHFSSGDTDWLETLCAAVDAVAVWGGEEAVAGVAALVLCIVLGRRRGWPREAMRPHNLTMVMLGAGLLWFGWFGFNAGSSGAADWAAAFAFTNTIAATAAAILGWLIVEKVRHGKATSLGAASGIVAGLVAITPACAAVSPLGALAIGVVAGALSAYAVGWKYKLGYDDSFDVVGVHLVGGLWGTLAVGLFASAATTAGVDGLFYGGGLDQLWRQALGAGVVLVYSFVLTMVIGFVIARTMRFRVAEEQEVSGIDGVVHAETAYDFASLGGGGGAATLGAQAHAEARNTLPATTERSRA